MTRTNIILALLATTAVVLAVVAFTKLHTSDVSSDGMDTHDVTSFHPTPQPTIPESLNIPASAGTQRIVDQAALYSVELPASWTVIASKGSGELEANQYSYISVRSSDYNYNISGEFIDNPTVPLERGMEVEVNTSGGDACTATVSQTDAIQRTHAEDVVPDATRGSSPKSEWELAHPHEVKTISATFKHNEICISVKATYNAKTTQGETLFKDIVRSFLFAK